jgi:hypothetical protein
MRPLALTVAALAMAAGSFLLSPAQDEPPEPPRPPAPPDFRPRQDPDAPYKPIRPSQDRGMPMGQQMGPGGQATMIAHDGYIFIFMGGTLYKVDPKEMKIVGELQVVRPAERSIKIKKPEGGDVPPPPEKRQREEDREK